MKNLAAILGGFCLTLAIFAGGALTAIFLVHAEPAPVQQIGGDAGALWTNKAVRVGSAQDLERIPARPAPQQTGTQAQPSNDHEPADNSKSVDATSTTAIATQTTKQVINAAHVNWCSRQFRSYDPADNSYKAYSGPRRECISPYSGANSRAEEPEPVNASAEERPALITAAHSEEMPRAAGGSEHIRSCFDRYRSYRPEDNSYQPYSGGPRQQCE